MRCINALKSCMIATLLIALVSVAHADSFTYCINSTTSQTNVSQTLWANNNQTNVTISENTQCTYGCSSITGTCNASTEPRDFGLPLVLISLVFFFLATRAGAEKKTPDKDSPDGLKTDTNGAWYMQFFFIFIGLIFLLVGVQIMSLSATNSNTITLLGWLFIVLVFVALIMMILAVVRALQAFGLAIKEIADEKAKDKM